MCFKVKSRNTVPIADKDNESTTIDVNDEFSAPSNTHMCFFRRCFFFRKERLVFWIAFLGQTALVIHFPARV